jgi:serine phosphatase RsbU (regulator of sigma subunit)/PAS domain-containing protein
MSQNAPDGAWIGLSGLAERSEALRQAAGLPGADPQVLLDAAFAELDGAIGLLTVWEADGDSEQGGGGPDASGGRTPDALAAERRLLRAVFQQAPVPLFVLEQDGTVRRANAAAGELLGSSTGYATGRPLSTFVGLPSRAPVQSQLAAVARTGTARQVTCEILGPDGPVQRLLTVGQIELPDAQKLLVGVLTESLAGKRAAPAARPSPSSTRAAQSAAANAAAIAETHAGAPEPLGQTIQAMTRRMDTVTAVTRLLLDNSTFNEAVTLQRCARLLAGDIASWVMVDMERGGRLRRQYVIGPSGEREEELARRVRNADPQPDTAAWQVHTARKPVLLAYAVGPELLGTAPDGKSLLLELGATSLLSVPIADGTTSYGTLTLVRLPDEGRFEIADLALVEAIGAHLGIAIRVDRMFRHRSAVAEALQASLLPARLPDIPGIDLSAAYLPAGEGLEVSGDFYDVFAVRDGWGITIGDVCGKGQEAAAMTAAARHAIRVLAAYSPDPVDVLAKANDIMIAGDYEDRFVTAKLAYLKWEGRALQVTLASAGHPGPAVVRSDGRVEILNGGGLPLGLFSAADLPGSGPEAETLLLHAGDLLFFYSDGVTDARNSEMDYFEERLADELAGLAGRSAAETARAVQNLLIGFSQDELRDDLTILVARVTDPPE